MTEKALLAKMTKVRDECWEEKLSWETNLLEKVLEQLIMIPGN